MQPELLRQRGGPFAIATATPIASTATIAPTIATVAAIATFATIFPTVATTNTANATIDPTTVTAATANSLPCRHERTVLLWQL